MYRAGGRPGAGHTHRLGVEFAAPVLFVSLMMAASNRRDKLAAAAMAMGLTYFLAALPNRTGFWSR